MDNTQTHTYDLIRCGLQEIIGEQELKDKIIAGKQLNVYWGTAPTGKPHFGYLQPMLKIADLVEAGCNVTILLADLHAFLDSSKSPINKVKARTLYYKQILTCLLEMLLVDISKVQFVIGSEYQLKSDFMFDVLKLGNLTSVNLAKHAGTEVVKQTDNPLLTSLLYPLMQALDEHYLNADIELGGVDQRKIFTYSRETMPKLGYKKSVFLMNTMIPALSTVAPIKPTDIQNGGEPVDAATVSPLNKMSATDQNSKIDILDTPNAIKKKINSCYCLEGEINDNNLLLICEKVIFKILQRKKQQFIIARPEKYGGPIIYENTEAAKLIQDFQTKQLHPMDLKTGIFTTVAAFFEPIRTKFTEPDLIKLTKEAYD